MDEVVRLIFSAASVVAVTSDGLDSRPQASPILSDVTLVDAGETAA
jgi:hypothetical protein